MIWGILGIEETKDKKSITNAYRERLSRVNPEEKPEEFKELRMAYEEALKLADQVEKPQEEKSDIELWTDDLTALYNDLPRRIDIGAWKKLLSQDICKSLDTRTEIEDALIRFMMDHYQYTHEVMLYLEEQFEFTAHMDELREKYPQNFLEYIIINGLRYEDGFPLRMFEPGLDGKAADRYEALYHRNYRADAEERESLCEQMRNSSEKHPYGEALLCKIQIDKGETDPDGEAIAGLIKLHNKWPNDDHLALDLAYGYMQTGRIEEADKLTDELLERNPELFNASRLKAEAQAALGNYREAVDMLNNLMGKVVGEQATYYELDGLRREWNDKMMEQLNAKLEENPDDASIRYDMIFCLIQNGRMAEADELADDLPFEQPDPFSYYNAKSVLASDAGRREEALECTEKLLEAVDNLKPDGTKRTTERMGRRNEVLGRICSALFDMGRKEEAYEKAEQSILGDDADLSSLFFFATICLDTNRFERAEEICDMILEKEPENSGAIYYKAYANFRMGRDNIAFRDVNTALEHDGSSLQYYLLKLRILTRNEAYDAAQELIDFLADNGIADNSVIDYCRLAMFHYQGMEGKTKEDFDEILETAAKIDANLKEANGDKADDYPDWACDFYYLYAAVTADRQNFDKEYPTEPIIEILDMGLAVDPEDYPCRSYKAWLLRKSGHRDEALEIYKQLEALPLHNRNVEQNLLYIYYNDVSVHAQESLYYSKLLIEADPDNGEWLFYAGMSEFKMENPEAAEKYFRKEQELDPEDIDGFFRMAYTLLKLSRLEEAAEQARKTVEMAKERDADTVRFWYPLIHACRRMGRTEEAIAAIDECAKYNSKWDWRELKFDTYCQAGMYKEAEKLLGKWNGKNKLPVEGKRRASLMTNVYIVQRNWGKLKRHLREFDHCIDPRNLKAGKLILALVKGDAREYLRSAEEYYKKVTDENNPNSYYDGEFAFELYVTNQKGRARELAAKSLEDIDRNIKLASGCRLLYMCKKIPLLAILGRFEEARQLVLEAEKMYLCENCDYCSCKDLDIFITDLELIEGNYEKALEKVLEAQKKWPDETDFVEREYLIKLKGKL